MATFKFELVSPERLVMSTEVDQVDLPGVDGDFGVLANHSPFLTTLRPGVLAVRTGSETVRVFIRGGFADISPAGLTVLAEKAIPVADLKADQIATEIRNAEEDVADAKTPDARQRAEQKLAQLRDVAGALRAA